MGKIDPAQTTTLDNSTRASDPVSIGLSDVKLSQFHPIFYQQKQPSFTRARVRDGRPLYCDRPA
jgi:hypothetical protein